jgi:hypothetical protein
MNELVTSFIRTVVPLLVGSIIAWMVSIGVELPENASQSLSGALTVLFTTAYYLMARVLEVKVSPKFGALLGSANKPAYPKAK